MPNILCELTFIVSCCFSEQSVIVIPGDIQCSKIHRPCTIMGLLLKHNRNTTAVFLLIWWRAPAVGEEHIILLDDNWKNFTQEATGNSVYPTRNYGTSLSAAYNQFRDEVLSPDNQSTFQSYSELCRLWVNVFSVLCSLHGTSSFPLKQLLNLYVKTIRRRFLFNCICIREAYC